MKPKHRISFLLAAFLLLAATPPLLAQPGFTPDIKKEKPFEERVLRAEKTGEGKLKTTKRIFQNMTTRFNYYFNANNAFNEVIERAVASHKDDYSDLISFYNYDLATTAADSAQLDSIIYKSRTGIVNHDLRNEWIDELYLLWGASYHLQKKLDSAALMFQFINYAYAPQDEDGFYKFIGSRADGDQELSIATREKKKFLHSNTFSRNNAFLWQIRTLTEIGDFTSSGSLISTLKRDPQFPKRLTNGLEEAEAYWWYKQARWDSAAVHLQKAIKGAPSKAQEARWYYLAAQLMERTGQSTEAAALYAKAIGATPDPVMEVYARLNLVRINKEGGDKALDQNLAELLKMARRDKYEDYRDVIYFMAAQMELERGNIGAAQALLLKGTQYSTGNSASRSKAFVRLADVAFAQKKYLQAAMFYDSVQLSDVNDIEARRVQEGRTALVNVVLNTGIITRQDSLQRIAAMPAGERDAYIAKLVKRLRREQGLTDAPAVTGGGGFPTTGAAGAPPPDLFNASGKGEWYFYNTSSRTQGAAQFKQVWGGRPNADNWRRFAVVSQSLLAQQTNNTRGSTTGANPTDGGTGELTDATLLAALPLTADGLRVSNDSVRNALYNLGSAYANEVPDYAAAITTFEELRRRFPDAANMDEVQFNLYFAYTKTGNAQQASAIKKLLQDRFPASRFTGIVTTGKDPLAKTAQSPEATKTYEGIYNTFIEGRFEEAEDQKRIADSTYKTNFWQPQLLYIEAVYNIRQREDSVAKARLQTIISQNTNTALTAKAQNLLSVLSRRQQIEAELAAYQIQNKPDSTATAPLPRPQSPLITAQPAVVKPAVTPTVTPPTAVIKPPLPVPPVKKDTVVAAPKKPDVAVKPVAPKPVDTATKKPVVARRDTAVKKPVAVISKPDTVAKKPTPPINPLVYNFVPEAPHFAMIVLDKVDPVFGSEARNAFARYSREKYYGQPLEVTFIDLTADTKLLLVGSFATAQAAVDYGQQAKRLAPIEIIPWLTGNKYSFTVISAANFKLLQAKPDVAAYKAFLEKHLPGKF